MISRKNSLDYWIEIGSSVCCGREEGVVDSPAGVRKWIDEGEKAISSEECKKNVAWLKFRC